MVEEEKTEPIVPLPVTPFFSLTAADHAKAPRLRTILLSVDSRCSRGNAGRRSRWRHIWVHRGAEVTEARGKCRR